MIQIIQQAVCVYVLEKGRGRGKGREREKTEEENIQCLEVYDDKQSLNVGNKWGLRWLKASMQWFSFLLNREEPWEFEGWAANNALIVAADVVS